MSLKNIYCHHSYVTAIEERDGKGTCMCIHHWGGNTHHMRMDMQGTLSCYGLLGYDVME